jgi:hypothetical protein
VEDRVKTLKATGAGHLPFHHFQANAAWFELALLAHDIMVWAQQLLLDGEHRIAEPKRLRYRILHVAGQITRHARRTTLHLPADWPWAAAQHPATTRHEPDPPLDAAREHPPRTTRRHETIARAPNGTQPATNPRHQPATSPKTWRPITLMTIRG